MIPNTHYYIGLANHLTGRGSQRFLSGVRYLPCLMNNYAAWLCLEDDKETKKIDCH
jgi:hypothetical protein